MIRLIRTAGLVALVSALAAFTQAARGAEVGPEQTGWWSEANQAPAPLPGLPPPPNVPPGGVFVSLVAPASIPAGAAGLPVNAPVRGTVAYGAVLYPVPGGSAGSLVLTTASGSTAATAQLQACNVAAAWTPADGGPWFAQPGYDSGRCVTGTVATDGMSVTFPVTAALTLDGRLDVAIVPAPAATPFAIAFAKPGPTSLTVTVGALGPTQATASPGSAGPSAVPNPGSAQSSFAGPGPSSGSGVFGPPGLTSGSPARSLSGPSEIAQPAMAPFAQTVNATINPRGPSGSERLIIAAMLLCLLAGWLVASRPGLVFLFAASGDQRRLPADHDLFGIGPFAKHRSGPPPPI